MNDQDRGVLGIVLAAGAGRRAGGPKALRRLPDGTPWVAQAVRTLVAGGCGRVVVVLGAGADQARSLVPAEAIAVIAEDWPDGIGASLRQGLQTAITLGPTSATQAAMVSLVDLPQLPTSVVERLLTVAPITSASLRRAGYAGRPGHPVIIGRDHWSGVLAGATPNRAAGPYLRDHAAQLVDCSDLWDGRDIDGPPEHPGDVATHRP